MSLLRLITGPSGSGKSRTVYEEVIRRAGEERNRNFFFIVPDQAAMSAQKALVELSPDKGILNIDVFGFGRFSHRILEETGQEEIPVLDDMGMSLILRKIAAAHEKDLPVLGSRLRSAGYIKEVKSALSEFMQYGISPDSMDELIDCSAGRGVLKGKLNDLKTLYGLFEEYISGHYITREEKLDILCGAIPESSILPDSVIVFDGFTGFTPVQNRVIGALMGRCSEMIVTLECSDDEDVTSPAGEEELFYLSHKAAAALIKLAGENGMEVSAPEMCSHKIPDSDIAFLERNIFRKKRPSCATSYSESVHITEMTDPAKEVHYIGVKLKDLLSEKAYAYRDIAIVCGDVAGYASYFEREFSVMKIPYYLDCVNALRLDPLTETVQAYLEIFTTDYSPASITRFLKGGLSGISAEDTDLIDNYLRQTGIRGYNAWHRSFTRTVRSRKKDASYLERINKIREEIIGLTGMFEGGDSKVPSMQAAGEYVKNLYNALIRMDAPEKLRLLKREFEEKGDLERSREFGSVWKMFVDLFDKIYLLTGDEEVSPDTFAEMMESGIGEMKVPGLPQNVDRVMIGDIGRTRLENVKVLFLAGVNDGNIPASVSGKGIISDLDREYLYDKGIELAPTPRQQMYTQRQYLYMNICKPSDSLYVSYSRVKMDGKAARPSYLIPLIKRLLPYTADVYRPEDDVVSRRVATKEDALQILSVLMRDYADTGKEYEKAGETFALFSAVGEAGGSRKLLKDSVYKKYLDLPLSKEAAGKLYPGDIRGSVSSLETYAGCPYKYFLTYGLGIRTADSPEIESTDRGNLAHDILKKFSNRLKADGLDWVSFTDEYASEVIPVLAAESASEYISGIYSDSSRNEYNILRLSRLVINSVRVIRDQISSGSFRPVEFEKPFSMDMDLGEGRKLHMSGIIDRVDKALGKDGTYLQIVDYKSGSRDLDLAMLMDGRQIQLPLYMFREKEITGGIPASMLYFRIQDPIVTLNKEEDRDKIAGELLKQMKSKGEVLGEEEALSLLDKVFEGMPPSASSKYLNVNLKADGTFDAYSKVLSREVMNMVTCEAADVAKREALEILGGRISVDPYESACAYCSYRAACGMDKKIPGYKTKSDDKAKRNVVIAQLCSKYEKKEEGGNEDGV